MSWQRPSPRIVWRAIEIYLEIAYSPLAESPAGAAASSPGAPSAGGAEPPPSAVRARLETLKSTPNESFYDSPVFERQEAQKTPGDATPKDGLPQRYALRLGNRTYPHMKFIIDRSPDGLGYLLRADTHDAHIQPKGASRDTGAFAELMKINRTIADAIEGKWEQMSLPTFKKFLRDDLERRKAK
jgi:hypothetical protein